MQRARLRRSLEGQWLLLGKLKALYHENSNSALVSLWLTRTIVHNHQIVMIQDTPAPKHPSVAYHHAQSNHPAGSISPKKVATVVVLAQEPRVGLDLKPAMDLRGRLRTTVWLKRYMDS